MSYRNDHEAALLRVDALEQEVARLRSAPTSTTPAAATKRSPVASWFRIGLVLGLAGAGVVAMIARDRPTAAAASIAIENRVELPQSLAGVRDCIAAIEPLDRAIDATTTDPHGAANSTSWIAATGAPCRTLLASLDEPDPVLRDKLGRWATAEDKLVDPISLITVYYASDPYALDNYASAPQLWREYHRARLERDDALADLARFVAVR